MLIKAFKYLFSRAISFSCELTNEFSLELMMNKELSPISNNRSSALSNLVKSLTNLSLYSCCFSSETISYPTDTVKRLLMM